MAHFNKSSVGIGHSRRSHFIQKLLLILHSLRLYFIVWPFKDYRLNLRYIYEANFIKNIYKKNLKQSSELYEKID